MKKIIIVLIVLVASLHFAIAQLDSIYDQSVWRTFIVHLPKDYTASQQYPIVLNLHGYNSDASQQQFYSQFDKVADSNGFIVVYPNAIANSWSINGNTDVNFLSHLVDIIRTKYSCNSCIFVTGMSDGGFMTYKFACTTKQSIKAIAVGSGNMSKVLQNSSDAAPKIPVMHFHGTTDPLVAYGGVSPFIPPVDTTIQWWVRHNTSNATPTKTLLPNTNTADGSTVEKYYYDDGLNGSEVTFYKVINGGHTWSGAVPIPPFGNTNQDINQSEIIGTYFSEKCSTTTSIDNDAFKYSIIVYPNPFTNQLTFSTEENIQSTLKLYDHLGRLILNKSITSSLTLLTHQLIDGIYFYELQNEKGLLKKGKVIKL